MFSELKTLADQHKVELGFIRKSILYKAQEKGWLLVAVKNEEVIGFANFRIRQDNNATLYDIVVDKPYRKQNIGKRLIQRLTWLVNVASGEHIRLKCPQSLPANAFYEKLQFIHIESETGKKRPLNVWHYSLPSLPRTFEFHENGTGFLYNAPGTFAALLCFCDDCSWEKYEKSTSSGIHTPMIFTGPAVNRIRSNDC